MHGSFDQAPTEYPNQAVRFAIIGAAAIMLTFARGNMLAVTDQATPLDLAMNLFALGAVPLGLLCLVLFRDARLAELLGPFGLVAAWVGFCLCIFTPQEFLPDRTSLVSIAVAFLVMPLISRGDLRYLRYGVLIIAVLFAGVALIYAPGLLREAVSGSVNRGRLGADISPRNVIMMPRVYYALVFTCLASAVIENRWWFRLSVLPFMIVPGALGLAAGSRGPLLGFVAAVVVLVLGARKRLGKLGRIAFAGLALVVTYKLVSALFPLLLERASIDDTQRRELYGSVLSRTWEHLSLFGRGKGNSYAHNVFLEFLQDYGMVGLVLFSIFLSLSLRLLWKVYRGTRNLEVCWVGGLVALQLIAQQLSANIFTGEFWAVLLLPIGLYWGSQSEAPGFSPVRWSSRAARPPRRRSGRAGDGAPQPEAVVRAFGERLDH